MNTTRNGRAREAIIMLSAALLGWVLVSPAAAVLAVALVRRSK